jgi:uncharacterized protein (DUF362 family)
MKDLGTSRSNGRISRRAFLAALGGATAAAAASQACRALGITATLSPETVTPADLPPTAPPLETAMTPSATPVPSPIPSAALQGPSAPAPSLIGRVALVRTRERASGVRRALGLLDLHPVAGKRVFLKPNYNTADPAPASTHPEVLQALVDWLRDESAQSITIGDRSGMGNTRRVMELAGAFELANRAGLDTVVFDELSADNWVPFRPEGSHWQRGFSLARPAVEADAVVTTCCLKTHRFGGHFTLSLKNSIGLVAKTVPGKSHNYMDELHGSSHQRRMIAEVNSGYAPAVAVIDGVEAFIQGGPDAGTRVDAEVVLASADRVALDAVGAALLRYHGSRQLEDGSIFQQEQIARAVELGLGASSPDQITFLTDDEAGRAYVDEIWPILSA